MTDERIINKITSFLKNELTFNVGDIVIFKNDNNSYELFNKYIIEQYTSDTYRVRCQFNSVEKTFSSIKSAVTWCIFDQRGKFAECNRIEELDRLLQGIDVSISLYKKFINKKSDVGNKLIYMAKLSEYYHKKKSMNGEMTKFIAISKQWQEQKFKTLLKNG